MLAGGSNVGAEAVIMKKSVGGECGNAEMRKCGSKLGLRYSLITIGSADHKMMTRMPPKRDAIGRPHSLYATVSAPWRRQSTAAPRGAVCIDVMRRTSPMPSLRLCTRARIAHVCRT